MCFLQLKYKRSVGPLFFWHFFINYPLLSQDKYTPDSVSSGGLYKNIVLMPDLRFLQFNSLAVNTDSLIPPNIRQLETSSVFLDSLKIRAEKYTITRKLYDFMVVSNNQSSYKQMNESSETDFSPFAGKKIRKIEIRRLMCLVQMTIPIYPIPTGWKLP